MKKMVIITLVALIVAFVAVCITLAIKSNRESEDTINRIDSKIERCEDGR